MAQTSERGQVDAAALPRQLDGRAGALVDAIAIPDPVLGARIGVGSAG